MAVVDQPKNMSETLTQLQVISSSLDKKIRKIQIEIINLKSIRDTDTFSVDTFIASLYKKDEYTTFINSLDIKGTNNELVIYLLTILLTGSIDQIYTRLDTLTQMVGENIRILLKRCFLVYKINEDRITQLELSAINKAIDNIKSINSYY